MPRRREIVFVRGTTEAINLVAASWGRANVGPGDEILITGLEHHSNIVPWQLLCEEAGARLVVAPIDDRGEVLLEEYERRLGPRTRSSPSPTSRTPSGTINPVALDGRDCPAARCGRRGRGGRRRPGGAAPAGRRPGPRLRLLRLLRPQALRPERHRRALGPGRAARRHAALAGRRRHDPHRHLRARPTYAAAARTASRPARRRSRGRSASRRRSTTSRPSAARRSRPGSRRSSPAPTALLAEIPGVRLVGTAREKAARPLVRRRGGPSARRRHRPRPRRASRSAPATTAPSR